MSTDNKPAAPGLVEALRQIKSLTKTPWVGDEEREAKIIAILDAALSHPVPSAPEPSKRAEQLRASMLRTADEAIARARQVPTDEQIERHALSAGDCPPQSRVILVSAIKRLREKALSSAPASAPEPSEPRPLPESMTRDEMLVYYSNYANVCAREALQYQRRIRELEAAAPHVPAAAPAVEPTELQRQVRDLTDTELGTLLTPYEAKNFSGLLKKVRALIDAALPASPEPATQGAAKPVHTDHPFQHWDRTCPACVLEASPPVPKPATQGAAEPPTSDASVR